MKTLIEQRVVAAVPVMEFSDPGAGRKLPVVLMMHGFSGKKEDLLGSGFALARQGFFAVSIDLQRHGELGDQPFVPAAVSPHLDDVVNASAAALDGLIAAYQRHPAADGSRVALLGYSLGGTVIYRYLPQRSPLVRAAAALIAGPDPLWVETLRRAMPLLPAFGITEALLEAWQTRIPERPFLNGVADFPLLVQYGQADPIIPIEKTRSLFAQIRATYTQPEKFQFVEHEGVGHDVSPAMFAQAVQWLQRWVSEG